MELPEIENLNILEVVDNVLIAHQKSPPYYFSCCDGLIILPEINRNKETVLLDLNIEPHLIKQVERSFGPVSNYVCTHGHMDHIAHVHQWESLGAEIYAPIPEYSYLLNLRAFYEGFGFKEALDFSIIQKFAKLNGYRNCQEVHPFKPGEILKFDDLTLETVPFLSHSKAHIGFYLPKVKIIHISCLGFDQPKVGIDGFGPWYGFKECSIEQYLKDIDLAESIFLEKCNYLTSSHSYVVHHPDTTPFEYMRKKIEINQEIVDQAILNLNIDTKSESTVNRLLELDLFFPKEKMKGFLKEIYNYWERGIITKHIAKSKYFK